MTEIPDFKLYGESDPEVEARIQPQLPLRRWNDLTTKEKRIAFQELRRAGWLDKYSKEAHWSVEYLNYGYLRLLPGKRLHNILPTHRGSSFGSDFEGLKAGFLDFQDIFVDGEPGELVLRMLSAFASAHIDQMYLKRAKETGNIEERIQLIEEAFVKYDRLAKLLNRIFEQFSINVMATRNGFVPRQDDEISRGIYKPTLKVLSDPKWESVSGHLGDMFQDYHARDYPEVITKAHSVVQRFLQILVGEEGKSGKGELGRLFEKAKDEGVISDNRFTEPIVKAIQSFIVSERATNSTAKPTLQMADSSDALLVINVLMVFLQHCLQNTE